MTAPRQVLPDTTYLVTRRCAQRQLLLRPSRSTNAIFLYVLALAARRYGVRVHAFCVLSNHFHVVVTDPDARLPAFEQYLDGLVARAVNSCLGRWEAFWAPSSYSAVALETPADVISKVAYVLANPVAAGLVTRGAEWPGLWSSPDLIGGAPLVARRPDEFFRPNGHLPETVELQLDLPPGFESPDAWRERVRSALAAVEDGARLRMGREGRAVVGVAKVLAQNPFRCAGSEEPRRELKPRVAARDTWKRLEALTRLLEFLRDYRVAWKARRSGLRHVLFPAGTYLLRVQHGVQCASG